MAAQLPVKPPAEQKLIRTNQLKFLKNLLEEILKKDSSTEFLSIKENESIKYPMDFSTIQLRLKNQFYTRGRDCIKDIHLIFSNASKYSFADSSEFKNAKALESFFYERLDDLPKPECELPGISDKNSKPTQVRKKEKKSSPNRRKNNKKLTYCPPIKGKMRSCHKNIASKNQDAKVKKFVATVEAIISDLGKLHYPLNYVDNLKIYDCLLKVKAIQEKLKNYAANKKKKESTTKISIDCSSTKKSDSEKRLKIKERKDILPSRAIDSTVSIHKDVLGNPVNLSVPIQKSGIKSKLSQKEKVNENPDTKPRSRPTQSSMVKPKNEKTDKIPDTKSKSIPTSSGMVEHKKEKADKIPDTKSKSIPTSSGMVEHKKEKADKIPDTKSKSIPTSSGMVEHKKEKTDKIPDTKSKSIPTSSGIVKHKKEKTDKIPDIKPRSRPTLPSANMKKPEYEKIGKNQPKVNRPLEKSNLPKPEKEKIQNVLSPLDVLLQSERFRPLAALVVTEERKRQREIESQKRKSLGGKIDFCRAADIMRAFEREHGLYLYNEENSRWPTVYFDS